MNCKVFTCVHNKVCKSYIGGVNCKVLTWYSALHSLRSIVSIVYKAFWSSVS